MNVPVVFDTLAARCDVGLIAKRLYLNVLANQFERPELIESFYFYFVDVINIIAATALQLFDGVFLDAIPIVLIGKAEIINGVALVIGPDERVDIEVCKKRSPAQHPLSIDNDRLFLNFFL